MTKLQPKISIVTVVFNGDKQLQHTINSIVEQTYKNIEFIIVDGKSTDNTPLIIKKNKANIAQVICEQDLGIYDAMNKGVVLATGDYINFMNCGDTFVSTNTVKTIVSELVHSSEGLFYSDHLVNYPNGKKQERVIRAVKMTSIPLKMPFCHQTLFAKTHLYKSFPFDLNYNIAADFNFICQCIKSGYYAKKLHCKVAQVSCGGVSDIDRITTWNEYQLIYQTHEKSNFCSNVYYMYKRQLEKIKLMVKKYVK